MHIKTRNIQKYIHQLLENFPAVMPVFLQERAILQVANVEDFKSTITNLLINKNDRDAVGFRAAQVVAQNRGMIEKTVQMLADD